MVRLALRFAQRPEHSIRTAMEGYRAAELVLQPEEAEPGATGPVPNSPPAFRKDYARLPFIPLNSSEPARASLTDLFKGRRSVREFERAYRMSLKTLGDILGRAICNAEDPEGPKHRPYPSAGALYPVEVYVLAMRFQDLPSGLYHYDPHRHGLSALLEKDVSDDFRMMICDDAIADPNLVFIITAAFFRSCLKYEGRGYRYALIEAGAVAQTINLCCRSVGLDGIWLGGFADELVQDFLDINWEMEIEAPVLMLGVGKKREIGPL